jgi:hypothetical protein
MGVFHGLVEECFRPAGMAGARVVSSLFMMGDSTRFMSVQLCSSACAG